MLIVADMQNDFCLESGSLYVKGATSYDEVDNIFQTLIPLKSMKTIDKIYEQLLVALEESNYLVSDHDYTWEESFYVIVKKMEDDSQSFRLTVRLEEETIYATLDLKEVYVQERFYDVDTDYLPEDFKDEIKFEVDDPELIKNIVNFAGNIGFCGVSYLVNDLFNEIEELTERYSVEAINFLSRELDDRGYY